MRWLMAILAAAAMLGLPLVAAQAEAPRRLAHYTHQRWTDGSEAPGPVLDLAQDRAGYLWLATGVGLFRFDGIHFERIEAEGGDAGQGRPSALLATRGGEVWTSFDASGRFAVYRGGALRFVDAPPAPNRILAFAEGRDGAIWALTAKYDGEVLRFHQGRWRMFTAADGLPRDDALSMLAADDGTLWIAFCNSVVRLRPGATRFEQVRATPRANGRLSSDPAGRVWLSEKAGSYPLTGPGGRGPTPAMPAPLRTDDAQIRGAPMFDRDGNLWIAMRYGGVQRVSGAAGAAPRIEAFRGRDGLSSDVTNQVFEDREGNVWIATERGIDKFRPANLRPEPELTAPAAFGDKLLSASDGSVYVGEARTLYRVRPGGEPAPILRDAVEPQSLCEAPDGSIWIAFATDIAVWRDGAVRRRIPRPGGAQAHGIVFDCAFDADGGYWIATGGGGLHRYRDGRWSPMFGPANVDGFYPMTLVSGPGGRLTLQTGRDGLARIEGAPPRLRPLALRAGQPPPQHPVDRGQGGPQALTLYDAPNGDLFAAGAFGLTRLRGGQARTLWAGQPAPRIAGLLQTAGETWIAFPGALERFRTADLERGFAEGRTPAPTLSLGFGDGLTSRPHSHTQRALVRGGDGRLWLATETGTVWLDPASIRVNDQAPGVAIRAVTAGGRLFRDPAALRLRPGTSNLEIDYAVLSFADPRRAKVRYRLEGFDDGWVDPGARRQAFYTNLRPGKYRFQVVAANAEGVWNHAGAAVDLEVPPTFVQSRSFLALCLGAAALLLWALYRLRMGQVSARLRADLEARLEERERIARELHDTLLQSVQGLILRFQSVANRMRPEDPSRDLLESALQRADDVIVDGRNSVRGLRSADGSGDLRTLLQAAVDDAGLDPGVTVRVEVHGAAKPLHPLVAAELGRIAREALFNVALHAEATSVEAILAFTPQQLTLSIQDDGVGIPPDVLAKGGRPGHFGLVGMRERVTRIGGALTLQPAPGGGTLVKVTLPGRLAFAHNGRGGQGLPSFRRQKGAADA